MMAMDKLDFKPQAALDLEQLFVGDFKMSKENFLPRGHGPRQRSERELKDKNHGKDHDKHRRHCGLFSMVHELNKWQIATIAIATFQVWTYILYIAAFAYVKKQVTQLQTLRKLNEGADSR